jgi:hypothetical protein
MEKIIGREQEQQVLEAILKSQEAELAAIYGRRRVGKTFLIKNYFEKQLVFEISGIHHATLEQQLENFGRTLSAYLGIITQAPNSWLEAFDMLKTYLTPLIKKQKKVIFLDEFPWMNTPRSGFLGAFENFWNSWASSQKNLIVVLCGSAAAWMIKNVLNNGGGLHNRVTRKIKLLPFTVAETAEFLKERKVNLDQYQVLQLYMVMGGIPQYIKEVRPGKSATQIIDAACFTSSGFLHDEFKNLFHSLFDGAKGHMSVIRALAKKGKGLTRNEIIDTTKLNSGGGTTELLEELTESGFITPYIPFGRTAKDTIYRLTDEYSLFYLRFIDSTTIKGAGSWATYASGSSWKSWAGFAFENICIKHEIQIKKALGIENVHTTSCMWRYHPKAGEQGAQIDMLIDRADNCINICEMKFSTDPYEITKAYSKEIQNKVSVFRTATGTRKTIFVTMLTTYGVKNASKYTGLIQSEVTMDALFK